MALTDGIGKHKVEVTPGASNAALGADTFGAGSMGEFRAAAAAMQAGRVSSLFPNETGLLAGHTEDRALEPSHLAAAEVTPIGNVNDQSLVPKKAGTVTIIPLGPDAKHGALHVDSKGNIYHVGPE